MVDTSRRALLGAVAGAGAAGTAGCIFGICDAPPAYRMLNLHPVEGPRATGDGWELDLRVELVLSRLDDRPYDDVTLVVYDPRRRAVARQSLGPISESNGFDREADDGSGLGGCNFRRYEYERELTLRTDAKPGYVHAIVPDDACLQRDSVDDVVSPAVFAEDWDPEIGCAGRMPFAVLDVGAAPDHDHRDWPTRSFDARRTRRNPGGRGPLPGRVVWRAPVGDQAPTPVVQHGAVYVGPGGNLGDSYEWPLEEETLAAFDLGSGELAWTDDDDHLDPAFPPAVGDAVVLAAGETVRALDPGTGRERWRYDLGIDPATTPTLHGNRVIATDIGGMLTRLDVATGERAWERAIAVPDAPPATDGKRLYLAADDRLKALTADTGEQRWERELPVRGPPRVRDDGVYVVVNDELVSLDAADGTERWRSGRWSLEPRLAVGADAVYGTDDEALVAVDGESERWRVQLDEEPAVVGLVGDRLYATAGRMLGVFDPTSGERVGGYECETEVRHAVVAGEYVLVTTTEGELQVLTSADAK